MKRILLPVVFASVAAIGNALFALGQKKASGVSNGLFFVAVCAAVAVILSLALSPLLGPLGVAENLRGNGKAIALSGIGLCLTYLGFQLLYAKCGASQYVLYAVLSIITTTVLVGCCWLKEPLSLCQKIAIALALAAVVVFSLGGFCRRSALHPA